jgi:hypothetical protein
LTVVVFAITGQFMKHHSPPMPVLGDAARLMYRSRHIYILASGLVNLVLGLYLQGRAGGWRRMVQNIGSVLVAASAPVLIAAFIVEPGHGFQAEMIWSSIGLYALFGGCVAHAASGARQPKLA